MSVICGHNMISILWGNVCMQYCVVNLSRYSNKIESVGLGKVM